MDDVFHVFRGFVEGAVDEEVWDDDDYDFIGLACVSGRGRLPKLDRDIPHALRECRGGILEQIEGVQDIAVAGM